jgi:cytochrome c-type biogenesis protein CcmH/NrfG
LPSEYASLCAEGNAKVMAHDLAGGLDRYRAAIARFPKEGRALSLMGEALLSSGNATDARMSLNRAVEVAGESDPAETGRALFLLATVEEHEQKTDAARAAWQAYLDWAKRFPQAAPFAASAQSRLAVFDARAKQAVADQAVRARIASTQDGGVFTVLDGGR